MKPARFPLSALAATLTLVFATSTSAEERERPAERQERERPAERQERERDRPPSMAERCPWADADVNVSARDTEEGVALLLRGPAERESEIRQFAGRMAAMHARMSERRGQHHRMRDRSGMGHMMMQMPAAEVDIEDIEGGSRISLTPRDPEDLDKLRSHVQEQAEMMSEGRCPMAPQ